MLTYEEDDWDVNNWLGDGIGEDEWVDDGMGGYKRKRCDKYKCCCMTLCCFVCLLFSTGGVVLFFYYGGGDIVGIKCPGFIGLLNCATSDVNGAENNTIGDNHHNITINNYTGNNSGVSNYTENNAGVDNYINNNVYNNDGAVLNNTIAQMINRTILFIQNVGNSPKINSMDENNNGHSMDHGLAVLLSIGSVIGFIGMIVGTIVCVRKRTDIKNYFNRKTSSGPHSIDLTVKELDNYTRNHGRNTINTKATHVINPLISIFNKKEDYDKKIEHLKREPGNNLLGDGIADVRLAVDKDNDHYYGEAYKLYKRGIDKLICHMKTMTDSNLRFQMAKKIDIYVQRTNHLQKIITNNKLIKEIQKDNNK